MRLIRLAILSSVALPVGLCPIANAQSDVGGRAAATSQQKPLPGELTSNDEIVVTADRWGEAKVAAATEFSEEEIASHGADSIQELLARLAPFIDARGQEPVILINGKPAGFDSSILSYPAEALDRLAVLKPEAAAQYGESAGRRVVNLVLKKKFSMLDTDVGANFATAGGQYGGALSLGQTAISGDTRWNVGARVGRDSALSRTARDLPPRAGVFDSVGFVAAPAGGEIDPALSFLAGQVVSVAAIPASALSRMPALGDFAATANMLHAVDPDRFETLQSSRSNASLNIGVTRPLGDFSASLNLNAIQSSSKGLHGLPMASIVIPAGSPWSPFADDVVLTRPFAGDRALRSDNGSTSLGGSLTVNGRIGGWQTSFGINYSRNWATNLLEHGVDVAAIQQLIDAGDPDFNPYGIWGDDLLLASRGRTRGENISGLVNIRKAIVELPTGPITWAITANASRSRSQRRQEDRPGEHLVADRVTRRQMNGQMALSVPISRGDEAGPGWLGEMSADLSVGAQTMTNSRPQKRFSGNINWSPWPVVQFGGTFDYAEAAPSFVQLDAPIVTTINRVFDYARQEIAEPLWTTGGNPDLRRGSRQNLTLGAMVDPLGGQTLMLSVGYRQSVAKGGVMSFPELTPAIEAAFPDRVTRNAAGRLIAVDARAINIAHDTEADLSSGLALRFGGAGAAGRGKITADPVQFSVAVNYSLRLKDELLTRPGAPVIDQLNAGGQSRHSMSLQASAGTSGIGANLNGSWSSPGRLRDGGANANDLFISKTPMTINFSAFIEPVRLLNSPKNKGLLSNLKISIDVDNLFNGYRRVMLGDGTVPPGYSRDEIDPLGRAVRLAVRKRF